jgi:hypothetical protein
MNKQVYACNKGIDGTCPNYKEGQATMITCRAFWTREKEAYVKEIGESTFKLWCSQHQLCSDKVGSRMVEYHGHKTKRKVMEVLEHYARD